MESLGRSISPQHCLDTPGVHVIDCPVDYSENDRILHQDIKERSAAI